MKQTNFIDEMIVDNFAGGGGASTGIELATGRPVDIAINHDPDAIAMHMINHPYTKHYCESVWDVDPKKICAGRKVGLMWLSPDCKHFSRAKGGKPVSKNVRGLAWIAVKWAATVKPRVIILENVPEFVTWGRLNKDGKPDEIHKGETFRSFVSQLKARGYDVAWKELRACDYGAPTIRKRFFLVARCDGKPIRFPEPTYGDGLKPYKTAADCIDFGIPAPSIFERKKPLADNTIRRIARGLKKFTLDTGKAYIIQYHSETAKSEVRGQRIDEPIMTIDTSPRYAVVVPHITKYYSGDNYSDIGDPLHTITVKERNAIVESHLCILRNNQDCQTLNKPFPTICTSPGHFAKIDTRIEKFSGHNLKHWDDVREILNQYAGYNLQENEVIVLQIDGCEYFISDIGMRMLEPRELYRAQGFPEDYIIDFDVNGKHYSRAAQIARCGNAVPPPFAEALVRANLPEMCGKKYETMRALNQDIAM